MNVVHPLRDNQLAAVAPTETVWLSASAGTGKTQVLTSRVLRLLLEPGVEPDQILCLTFTKAGAAEMATRIGERLADWVRLDDATLALHLKAIGAPFGPAMLERARSRFAAVLDCPGGGLRIETIHAFSQWLLSAFPEEAGLRPGSRAMEDRDRDLLLREVLVEMLLDAQEQGDEAFIDALATLSLRWGEDELTRFLLRCAARADLWTGPDAWPTALVGPAAPDRPSLRARLAVVIGLPGDADGDLLAKALSDRAFPVGALEQCCEALRGWGTASADKMLGPIAAWLEGDPTTRAATVEAMAGALFNAKGEPKYLKNLTRFDDGYAMHAQDVADALDGVRDIARGLALLDLAAPALAIGGRFALAWAAAKAREGYIDFDDQIRAAAQLLTERAPAEWIRFKLDRRFDHVLVDEAQDTNAAQWRIVLDGLTGDFFGGERDPQSPPPPRTLFVVGDYKQAIFGFQGTSPANFDKARRRVARALRDWAAAADDPALELRDLGLGRSFRTAAPVLDFVDRAIAAIGPDRFGLPGAPEPHRGEDRPGLVCLWDPVGMEQEDEDPAEDESGGEEGWLSSADRQLADRIAQQVRDWLDQGHALVKGRARWAQPGDIMVLVRKRGDLAALIVARLHAQGVPVAGVDRLRLGAPLAVKDLLAALRFCVQPDDDLTLASLLVSPLLGWTQEDLLGHGYRGRRVSLWDHLRAHENAATAPALAKLRDLLGRADFGAPAALLNWILVGPWQGRRALVARLGEEAGDPIDELLNAAMAYAASHVPSLAGFLHWFAAGDGDVKREAGGNQGLVRVMTVHGSKGLQAPIVILADATGNPANARPAPVDLQIGNGLEVPLPSLRKDEKPQAVRDAEDRKRDEEREEHWRLLYVAMTRAEEALYVTGALGKLDKGEVPGESWYGALSPLMPDSAMRAGGIWGRRHEWGSLGALPPPDARVSPAVSVAVPPELRVALAAEPRPPRPLAPSALGEDEAPAPPTRPGPGAREAARRGTLLHKLLERLPDVAPGARATMARGWLARMAPDHDPAARAALAQAALDVLDHPDWQAVFGPGSLAEVPIAALVGTRMINGTIDRLLITPDMIRIVDFKTDRRPPADPGAIPAAYLRQMAAYVAAMQVIHPGRAIEAALLYTATPMLFALPASMLAAHAPKARA